MLERLRIVSGSYTPRREHAFALCLRFYCARLVLEHAQIRRLVKLDERRAELLIFEDCAVDPHMTAYDNTAFALVAEKRRDSRNGFVAL
jgi:hypothetical protein